MKDATTTTYTVRYIVLPFVFLTVALLGGVRLSADSGLIFVRPALICLILASILLFLYTRSGLIRINTWVGEQYSLGQNISNGILLLTLFAATTQLFNSLLPEQGLPLWVVGFCFFWSLWNSLFADLDAKKLLRSLGGLFGIAFVVKYLLLANLTATEDAGWLRGMLENPGQEVMTRLLELPRYSAGTGYIQFFTAALYLLGLYLLPQKAEALTLASGKLDHDPLPSTDHRERIHGNTSLE